MYAIAHGTTALAIKRVFPDAPLPALLVAVQAVELLWIGFTYLGIERFTTTQTSVHLSFLPYSHALGTGAGLAIAVLVLGAWLGRPRIGLALALAVISHVLLDLIHHEPDISLLPLAGSPRFGFNLAGAPWADLAIETAYGVACWKLFRGSTPLLFAILILNLLNAPLMNPAPAAVALISAHRWMLPTVILFQFLLTSTLLLRLSRPSEGGIA
ncbi:MAG: hypothetical protein IM653_05355 [Phenylobacterium sp.]|uniref:hypothetical protein n=1 Tax=Phenylobacterium sp. TaxID=1871053 RepID=UPI0025D84CE1|nr:hypothetical protein [Phenylobacterium sp.]MCA6223715.1 hypothetical protein [Phenylobacterium sp.]MCA6225785.1 hypothetical protein [Phenylobacterium sp.]MCA6230764.1 hypothetical protein [Phenylobacterium sp.]MCA6234545.1 hypothetical protein [Phenylobacterium sp.]MCA6248748.1 hypothetical protein [Phenylobacterium sp.]